MVVTTTRSRPGLRRRRGRRDSADGQVLGAILVLGGVGWFLEQVGAVHLSLATTLSCLLITLGIGLVLTARRAGGAGLVIVGLILTVVLASATAVDVGVLQKGVGPRSFVPSTERELQARYQLGVGQLTVDLTEVPVASLEGRHIDVQVGIGEVIVLLPAAADLAVDVQGEARAGDVNLFRAAAQHEEGGTNVVKTFVDRELREGHTRLDLDVDVGLGTIQVVRART
jgi:hypothetical protein